MVPGVRSEHFFLSRCRSFWICPNVRIGCGWVRLNGSRLRRRVTLLSGLRCSGSLSLYCAGTLSFGHYMYVKGPGRGTCEVLGFLIFVFEI